MKKLVILVMSLLGLGFGFSQLILNGPQSFAQIGNSFETTVQESAGSVSSSRILAANLRAAGFKRPRDHDAHHIVAGNAPAAARARLVLQKYSIDINDQINGVFLPADSDTPNQKGAAVHSKVHTNEYFEIVNQSLERAADEAQVREALEYLRQELLAGGL